MERRRLVKEALAGSELVAGWRQDPMLWAISILLRNRRTAPEKERQEWGFTVGRKT